MDDLKQRISERAYEIWLGGGGNHGCDIEHWLQAEEELNGTQGKPSAKRPRSRRDSKTRSASSTP